MGYLLLTLFILCFGLQEVQATVGANCVAAVDCEAPYEECANVGSDKVCRCRPLYALTVDGNCTSLALCPGCSSDATCEGGTYCRCNGNLLGNGATCESRSACNRTNPCHTDADCTDGGTFKEYNCTCKEGFVGDGMQCEDEAVAAVEMACSDTQMIVTILNSVYDNVTFALQNTSCIFTNNGTHNTLYIDYGTCGTTLTEDNDYLIYSNRAETSKDPNAIITRDPDHYIALVCKLERSVNVTSDQLNVTNFDSINITKDDKTTFRLSLEIFPTNAFTTPYANHQFPLQINVRDKVNVEVRLYTKNDDVKLIPQNCYATPTPSPSDATKHYIVQDRCGVGETYKEVHFSKNAFQFTFKAFQFLTTNDVYLHCESVICHFTSIAPECRFGCGSNRKRREVEERQITDEELEKYMLTSKQIILIQEKEDESTKVTNETIMLASLAIGWLIILATILAILMVYRLKLQMEETTMLTLT